MHLMLHRIPNFINIFFSSLFKKFIREGFVDKMNGIFGFVVYDQKENELFIARDHMGIIPLYIGWDKNKTLLNSHSN